MRVRHWSTSGFTVRCLWGHYVTESVELFIKEAEARSKGTLKFSHYPAQQLYTDMAMANVLPEGGVEMAQIQAMMFAGKVPEIFGGLLPGFYKDQDHYFRAAYDAGPDGGFMDWVIAPAFDEKANTKLLTCMGYSINLCTLTNKPVYKLEDYKGKKIRSLGKSVSILLQALGAAPAMISSSDIYMALQRGTIEGVFSGLTSFYERKWYESAKYVQYYYTGSANFNMAANLTFWNKLTPAQRKAIAEAALIAEVYSIERAMADESRAREALKAAGVEVFDFPAAEVKRLHDLARTPLTEMLEEDLGKELAAQILTTIDASREAKASWKDACEKHGKRLLAELK